MTEFINDFSEQIWKETYQYKDEQTIDDTFRRVAKYLSSAEKNQELKNEWENKFFELLQDFKFIPGGRILANAGTEYKNTSLINCYVKDREIYDIDSLDGIIKVLRDQAQTLKSEGGWGANFSFIRPRGAYIYGIGVETPGAIKYMELFDRMSDVITAGSNRKSTKGKKKIRKGALLGIIDCWHPDVLEFITSKQKHNYLNKFNISVGCYDDFMDRIVKIHELKQQGKEVPEELDKWELIFPDTTCKQYKEEWDGDIHRWKKSGYPIITYDTISAEHLWNLIIKSTYQRNDPGVLFLDRGNKTHCWYYGGTKSRILETNACGEQQLPNAGACNLGSLNLTQFVDVENKEILLDKLKNCVKIAVRMLDNVNDLSYTPLKAYDESLKKRRRIGIGVIGWASTLYLLKIKFGSKRSSEIKNQIMETICYTAIDASAELAKEKGMFADCNPNKHAKAFYFNQINLPHSIYEKIKKYGIRNSALFSIQPTGNTSILANNISSGIEPIFACSYIRTVIIPECPEYLIDKCPKYWTGEFKENEYFKLSKEGTEEILKYVDDNGTTYKIDKNRGLTKEIECKDYAVNILEKNKQWNELAKYVVTALDLSADEHLNDLAEFGTWIDSSISKTVNVSEHYSFDDFKDLYLKAYKTGVLKGLTTYRQGTMANVLAIKNKKSHNNKRPKTIPCDVYHISRDKIPHFVLVGLKNNKPYEVFAGSNKAISNKVEKGTITKIKRGCYRAEFEDGNELSPVTIFCNDQEEALTRMVSTSLRHDVPIQYIVQQLNKTTGDISSFGKCIARALKHYVNDGTEISGEECPECGNRLIFQDGCCMCLSCSWSRC